MLRIQTWARMTWNDTYIADILITLAFCSHSNNYMYLFESNMLRPWETTARFWHFEMWQQFLKVPFPNKVFLRPCRCISLPNLLVLDEYSQLELGWRRVNSSRILVAYFALFTCVVPNICHMRAALVSKTPIILPVCATHFRVCIQSPCTICAQEMLRAAEAMFHRDMQSISCMCIPQFMPKWISLLLNCHYYPCLHG